VDLSANLTNTELTKLQVQANKCRVIHIKKQFLLKLLWITVLV